MCQDCHEEIEQLYRKARKSLIVMALAFLALLGGVIYSASR